GQAVELAQRLELAGAFLGQYAAVLGRQVGDRRFAAQVHADAAVRGTEVAGAVAPFATAATAGRRAEHSVFRQALVQRAEPGGDPRPDRWQAHLARLPA